MDFMGSDGGRHMICIDGKLFDKSRNVYGMTRE